MTRKEAMNYLSMLNVEYDGSCSIKTWHSGIDKKMKESLDIAIEALGQRWIPVTERPPEEFAYVICSTDAKEVFLASYYGKLDDGEDCFDDYEGMMWKGDVIAWMPSPEPYEPERSDKCDKRRSNRKN